jgi:hypothetical protein
MLGAPLSEVWGENYKPKKKKKNKNVTPMGPSEMESELLVSVNDKRNQLLKDDRLIGDSYKPVNYANSNIVTQSNPYGSLPKTIKDDPDYQEFLEYKNNKNNPRPIQREEIIPKIDMNYQMNELLLYIFTGFFFLILYDNIYRLGKNSY